MNELQLVRSSQPSEIVGNLSYACVVKHSFPYARTTARVPLSMALYRVFGQKSICFRTRELFCAAEGFSDADLTTVRSSVSVGLFHHSNIRGTAVVYNPRLSNQIPIYVLAASQSEFTTLQDQPYNHTFVGARWIRRNSRGGQFFAASGDQKYQLTVDRNPASDPERRSALCK